MKNIIFKKKLKILILFFFFFYHTVIPQPDVHVGYLLLKQAQSGPHFSPEFEKQSVKINIIHLFGGACICFPTTLWRIRTYSPLQFLASYMYTS